MFFSPKFKPSESRLVIIIAIFALLVGCGESHDDDGHIHGHENDTENTDTSHGDDTDTIEVAGTWNSPWDSIETISNEKWDFMTIVLFDNDERFAITQNPADTEHGPNTFNKLVWTPLQNDSFHYCTVTFGQETAEDALNTTEVADDSDPANSGCGGFGWTFLERQ